jgi:hypothetical protein
MSTTVFVDCCDEEAALLVWNNLSLLGVTCCAALVAILLNMGSSFILYRRIKKDLQDDLDHGFFPALPPSPPPSLLPPSFLPPFLRASLPPSLSPSVPPSLIPTHASLLPLFSFGPFDNG